MEETNTYEVPYMIEFTSSDELSTEPNTTLADPIEIEVLDSEGQPVAGVLIYATVETGDVSFNVENTFNYASGIASFKFTLGAKEEQEIEF